MLRAGLALKALEEFAVSKVLAKAFEKCTECWELCSSVLLQRNFSSKDLKRLIDVAYFKLN